MRFGVVLLIGGCLAPGLLPSAAGASVALMAGQSARPLNGRFNSVPVLHSNQPEEVHGPGILVDTAAGSAIAAETGQRLGNATYTFNGDFGLHVHHKYYPSDSSRLGGRRRRGLLTIATVVTNPSAAPVTLTFDRGAVRNSFEAPYLSNNLMGVKPLGPRPWNTGPGDATAVQMLRGKLDRDLREPFVIPPRSQRVLLEKVLPARGIVNALVRGRSDGPFTMAVVAVEERSSEAEILAMLNSRRLAPGRIYLSRLGEISNGTVFSRVAGVAIGDAYDASLNHDLSQGPLHVPLTSTRRTHFGTNDIQVNRLASRMIDSSVNNVGTYGVRFDVDLALQGEGPHELVLSHPVLADRPAFTAFRGSIGIETREGYREVHVGMRSGQSLPLTTLDLKPGVTNPVTVSLVYPADATPGHLLSVVPRQQLALLQRRVTAQPAPAAAHEPPPAAVTPRPAVAPAQPAPATAPPIVPTTTGTTLMPARPTPPTAPTPPAVPTAAAAPPVRTLPPIPAARPTPTAIRSERAELQRRYQQAIEAQRAWLRELQAR
ncbi:DUF3370 family protein [Synechococcus sp. RSCCF101]|uniref:DUF3370 family protein n=1 Tax=Synechococcus sp. RSCCF101 TaxID=2511069 RepID=UPI001249124C|nr:DUF3370 family protein [Synechococcus sp. RSCCF101]QEY31736.1 DUF3370 family protein [Synechococcus sp. RSCCF101]